MGGPPRPRLLGAAPRPRPLLAGMAPRPLPLPRVGFGMTTLPGVEPALCKWPFPAGSWSKAAGLCGPPLAPVVDDGVWAWPLRCGGPAASS